MIYKVQLDTTHYQGIFVDHNELDAKMGDLLYPEGFPLGDEWETPEGSLYDATGKERDGLKTPDIASWVGNLTFNQTAYQKAKPVLSKFGEFLTVSINNQPWYVFNLLHTLDSSIVDQSRSERNMSGGIYMGLKKLVFLENKLKDELIFRTEYDEGIGQYCSEQFKQLLDDLDLTGLSLTTELTT
jgi:hypothetical protein